MAARAASAIVPDDTGEGPRRWGGWQLGQQCDVSRTCQSRHTWPKQASESRRPLRAWQAMPSSPACLSHMQTRPRTPPPPDESFERFASSVKHIACDRTDAEAMKAALSNKGFEGAQRAGKGGGVGGGRSRGMSRADGSMPATMQARQAGRGRHDRFGIHCHASGPILPPPPHPHPHPYLHLRQSFMTSTAARRTRPRLCWMLWVPLSRYGVPRQRARPRISGGCAVGGSGRPVHNASRANEPPADNDAPACQQHKGGGGGGF